MTEDSKKYWNYRNIAGYIALAMFFIADRVLKSAAIKQGYGEYREIIGGLIRFRLSANTGIAFSLGNNIGSITWITLAIVIALISYFFYIILVKKYSRRHLLPLTFIIIGAISNIIDRISYGAVIDYIDIVNLTVLNLSDVLIAIGVGYSFIQTKTNHAEKTAYFKAG